MILYEGPSLLTGEPIVVIATVDSNPKIGEMLCTWILLQDRPPEVAAYDGSDESICGDCKFRTQLVEQSLYGPTETAPKGSLFARHESSSRTCYVRLTKDGSDGYPPADEHMPPSEIWRKWRLGEFQGPYGYVSGEWETDSVLKKYRGSFPVRIGSYGDPAVVPTRVWTELVRHAVNWTGYTHLHKPIRCTACDQETQERATCPGGGLVSTESHQGVGSGMGNELDEGMGRCGIGESKPMLTDSPGSGSQGSGPAPSDTSVTIQPASIQGTFEAGRKRTTCETVSLKGGTSQDLPDTTTGERTGDRQDGRMRQETQKVGSCAKCNGTGWTWRPDPELKRYCMASVDTRREWIQAKAAGWTSFIVLPASARGTAIEEEVKAGGAILCPMTAKKPVTCKKCCLCRGNSGPARDIYEFAHGVNQANHSWWNS